MTIDIMTKFADCFWDTDINSQNGFDALHKRVKEGKKMLVDYEEFLKNRAKIEEEYVKKLRELTKKTTIYEIGTLNASLVELKCESDLMAQEHSKVGAAFHESARRIATLMTTQRNQWKQEEESMKRTIRLRKDFHAKLIECKRFYHGKSKELDSCTHQVQVMKNTQHKDFDKHVSRQSKLTTEKEQARRTYLEAVNHLDQHCQIWQREHERLCDNYQRIEEDRLKHMRSEMWSYTNILSQNSVDIDNRSELIRKSIEKMNIEGDIMLTIRERATGSTKPAKIEFEEYNQKVVGTLPRPDHRPDHRPDQQRRQDHYRPAATLPSGR